MARGFPQASTAAAPKRLEDSVLGVVVGAQALMFGASPLFNGYYALAAWGIVCIATLALLTAAVVVRRVSLTASGALALAGLVALLAWSAASVLWAQGEDQAWTETNRLGLYAGSFVLTLVCVRTVARARLVLALLAIAVAAVVLYITVRLLGGSGSSMFLTFRLNEPIGYINGLAGFLMMGMWLFLAMVHDKERPFVAGLGLGLATLTSEWLILTQSRAVVPAVAASVVVLLVFVGDRVRRGWSLVLMCAAVSIALPSLLDVYQESATLPAPADATVQRAALWAIVCAVVAGVIWGLAAQAVSRRRLARRSMRLQVTALVLIPVLVGTALVIQVKDPVGRLDREYQNFTSLNPNEQVTARYLTLGGFRYDLWRVAWRAFRDHPAIGLGAGNYPAVFAAQRQSPQYVKQPHSIELQALSELGVVGGIALLLFVAGLYLPLLGLTAPTIARKDVYLLASTAGMVTVWLVQTSVDWLYNLPGVTGIALIAGAVLVGRPSAEGEATGETKPSRARRAVLSVGLVAIIAVAASVGRQYAALVYLDRAKSDLAGDPQAALVNARRSLDLNAEAVGAYYTAAAASALLGDYPGARSKLLEATRREPFNYVPWALLGDLAIRRGDRTAARSAYARAAALSPFDPELQRLASAT